MSHHSFFRYCQLNFAKDPQPICPVDDMLRPPRQTSIRTSILPNGSKHEEEVELLTEFSWRNFFSTINFAKIMQKLSKNRSHRIWMLVQYKSSVCYQIRMIRIIWLWFRQCWSVSSGCRTRCYNYTSWNLSKVKYPSADANGVNVRLILCHVLI